VRCGAFEIDLCSGELQSQDRKFILQQKPFQILKALLERSGELITRDELKKRLWSSDIFVDFDHSLNKAVNRLREALGDSAENPLFIQTVSSRGYRFIAQVEPLPPQPTPDALTKRVVQADPVTSDQSADSNDQPLPTPAAKIAVLPKSGIRSRNLLYGSALAILAIVALALGLGFSSFKDQTTSHAGKIPKERQLTFSLPENSVLGAKMSPDGRYIAYADSKGIHWSEIDTGQVHDLSVPHQLGSAWPDSWFPDGQKLVVGVTSSTEGRGLWLFPIIDGTARELSAHGALGAVSPDGSSIAFLRKNFHEIWVMGANGENAHPILSNEKEVYGLLAWSATGQRLAYVRQKSGGRSHESPLPRPDRSGDMSTSIETISLHGGSPSTAISDLNGFIPSTIQWAGNGRMIFALGEPSGHCDNLWEILVDPQTGNPLGKLRRLTSWNCVHLGNLTINRDATRLALLKWNIWSAVYLGQLRDKGTALASVKRFTDSENQPFVDWSTPAEWTRDGKAILFSSNRTGRYQVFKQELGLDTPKLLIQGSSDEAGAQVTPDGKWVLYWSSTYGEPPSKKLQLMRFPTLGGSSETVLEESEAEKIDFHCPFSAVNSCILGRWKEGRLTFYALDPIHGEGQELAHTDLPPAHDLGWSLSPDWSVSPDGMRIAVVSWNHLQDLVRVLDLRDGTKRDLHLPLGEYVDSQSLPWDANSEALFATAHLPAESQVLRIELNGQFHVLYRNSNWASTWFESPSPSPDGYHLAFAQKTAVANVWLLENF